MADDGGNVFALGLVVKGSDMQHNFMFSDLSSSTDTVRVVNCQMDCLSVFLFSPYGGR